jgi:thioredoxin
MKKILFFAIILIGMACQSTSQSISNLKIDEFEKAVKGNEVQLIDVRTAGEYGGGHLPNAINMDVNEDEFDAQIKTLDKSKPVYVYCLSGGRSSSACKQMAKAGFTTLYNMEGGIMAWRGAAKNLVTDIPVKNTSMSMDTYLAMVKKDKPVLVEFFAPWCGPCKVLKPQVEQLSKDYADKLYVQYVNVDEHKQLADELKIKSIPVLMYYNNGKKQWEIVGAPELKALKKKLKL